MLLHALVFAEVLDGLGLDLTLFQGAWGLLLKWANECRQSHSGRLIYHTISFRGV